MCIYLIHLNQNRIFSLIVQGKLSKISGNGACNIMGKLAVKSCIECLHFCEENSKCEKLSCKKGSKICTLCTTGLTDAQSVENIYEKTEQSFRTTVKGE